MSLPHVAPGKLYDACRHWYPEPQRRRKLILAACGYQRLGASAGRVTGATDLDEWVDALATGDTLDVWEWQILLSPDAFVYDMLWSFGPPSVAGGPKCEDLNAVTLCVFGELTEDETERSPEVLRFDPKWRTETVVGIATKAYEDRAFAALPILADALEEAGCDNLPMLAHCRDAIIHTRGCWVLDHVLGKS